MKWNAWGQDTILLVVEVTLAEWECRRRIPSSLKHGENTGSQCLVSTRNKLISFSLGVERNFSHMLLETESDVLKRKNTEVTVNSLLTAVLDLADQDLIEERVKNNVPEVNWHKEQRRKGLNQQRGVNTQPLNTHNTQTFTGQLGAWFTALLSSSYLWCVKLRPLGICRNPPVWWCRTSRCRGRRCRRPEAVRKTTELMQTETVKLFVPDCHCSCPII